MKPLAKQGLSLEFAFKKAFKISDEFQI